MILLHKTEKEIEEGVSPAMAKRLGIVSQLENEEAKRKSNKR